MPDLTASEIASLSWCDANYEGYRWQSNPETPTLILHLVSNDKPSSILSCSWASRLTVDLAYDNHVGPLLTWDATFQPLPDDRWSIHVELPPNGYIKFECNDLRLVPVA